MAPRRIPAPPVGVRPLARRAAGLAGLPPAVAAFQLRAMGLAVRLEDAFALSAAARPADLRALLTLARGRRLVVELGTATAWTTVSLALHDRLRRVVTFDPVAQPNRERYLDLAAATAGERITFAKMPGASGAGLVEDPVELLFIDSTHERDDTLAEWEAWRPKLARGAVVVFHDYDNPAFPGVAEAVETLGLDGHEQAGMYVWRAPR